jgi:hypothetical protein
MRSHFLKVGTVAVKYHNEEKGTNAKIERITFPEHIKDRYQSFT